MKRKWMFLFTALVLFSLMLSPIGTASAQDPLPPTPTPTPLPEPPFPGDKGGPQLGPDGLWYMPEGAPLNPEQPDNVILTPSGLAPSAPDDFGYTWDDTVAFSWIDASSGTDTGLAGDDQFQGPINIEFSFKFYEDSYTQLYISTNGLVSFGGGSSSYGNTNIPYIAPPNNFIAPFWDDLAVGSIYNAGKIYYFAGGTSPNRYFVVEWLNVTTFSETSSLFSFEAILYENGDIIIQLQSLPASYSCTVGLENSFGDDGLQYYNSNGDLSAPKAIHFYRPAPSARVAMSPRLDGAFLSPSASSDFPIMLQNTGELGADTYDLPVVSTWPVSLYASDRTTLLTDTDSDGVVDSGSIPQGGQVTVIARVQAPASAVLGDASTALVTARSSVNTSKNKTATLQTSIPAPFAQVYRDNAGGAMKLDLIRPGGQEQVEAAPAGQYESDLAIASAPGWNLVYAWDNYRYTGSYGIEEIVYALVDRAGNVVHPASKLADLSGATMNVYDYLPALATAPNGDAGIVWTRENYNDLTHQYNNNIYLAILNPTGDVIYGPANLTNNTGWGTSGLLTFSNLQITATDDNRFVLAWQSGHIEAGGGVSDINYAVLDMLGGVIAPITNLTNNTPGSSTTYAEPALTALTSSRAFLSWVSHQDGNDDIHYAILNNDGGIVKADTDLSMDETIVDWQNWDAVQLPTGKILAVWEAWGCFPGEWVPRLRYVLLDSSYNRIGTPQCMPKAPGALTGESGASVTVGGADDGIITWQDNQNNYLYYALVNGGGNVLTRPTVFHHSQAASPYIVTSHIGYGNAAYADTFRDVAYSYWAQDWINRLYSAGITGGCGTAPLNYCPESSVTRAQMAIFLEKGMRGSAYTPPAGTGTVFADVPLSYWDVNWIEKLFADGITAGCGGGKYCPEAQVTRAQMAIFLLKTKYGAAYTPPAVGLSTGFNDVPITYWDAAWIKQLVVEGITAGCGGGNYCPDSPATRAQMAVFLVRTFNLP
jgi:hypothetical protein